MNLEGARLAKASAEPHGGLVAGSVGPLNVTLSMSPKVEDPSLRTVTFEQVYETYAEQIAALREGGVDLLLIETIFDTLNAKAAIAAALDVAPDLPRWISVTIVDRSGRTLSGQTVEAFWTSVAHADPVLVGVNCSLGATQIRPAVEALARARRRSRWRATRTPACPTPSVGSTKTPETTSRLLGRVRARRPRQPRRRLLRHHPRAHPPDRGGGPRRRAALASRGRARHLLRRPRAVPHHSRDRVRDGRRAHEHHRLEAVRAADRVGRLRRRGRRRTRAGRERREPDRRQHGRRPASTARRR